MNRVCLIVLISLFCPSLFSTAYKSKDFYIKILIYKGLPSLEHSGISVFPRKIVYREKSYSFKDDQTKFFARKSNPISVKGNQYYGRILVRKDRSQQVNKKAKLILINQIPLETYLIGVVDKEISYSWPLEAIKAQAIAARTYAVHHMIGNQEKSYHIANTTQHQVFKGVEGIHPKIIEGVEQTRGIILTYQDKPIVTFFHASCGGQTEQPQNVWFSKNKDNNQNGEDDYPYLKSVKCNNCKTHPRFEWDYSIGARELQEKLRKVTRKKIRRIKIAKMSPSKRAMKIDLVTSDGSVAMNGNDFRIAINPRELSSTKFKVKKKDGEFYFKGYGYGHGVGLCQWGVKTMAEEGASYEQILKFYYHGVQLKKMSYL